MFKDKNESFDPRSIEKEVSLKLVAVGIVSAKTRPIPIDVLAQARSLRSLFYRSVRHPKC